MKIMVKVISLLFFLLMVTSHLSATEQPSVLVRVNKVVKQTVSETVLVYGELVADPDRSTSISFSHGGYITRVYGRLGQRVKKGQELLAIDTSPSAHRQYLQASNAVNFARQEFAHQQRLQKEQLATRAQVESARKILLNAESSLGSFKKNGLDQTHTSIVAPIDGIITQVNVTQGQRVQADTTAMLIASEDKLVAHLGAEPEDLAAIKIGSPITLSSVFVPEHQISTTVREVHAMINPTTHLVDVVAAIPDEQVDHLVLGSRMTAQIELANHQGLVVPRLAVLRDEMGDFVFLAQNGMARRVAVTRGVESDKWVEIKGGLQAGDMVISTGNYELKDGMLIREGK